MNGVPRFTPLLGRILMSVIFLLSGFTKITTWSVTAGYLASKGLPAPNLLLAGAAFVEIVFGLCVLVGFQTRIAAFLLFLYLIPVTLIFHRFWSFQGEMRQENMIHFLGNLAIMGGMLILVAHGPGPYSVDRPRSGASA